MKSLVLVVAGIVVALGGAGIVVPETLIGIGRHMVTPAGLYAAGALRIGIGLVLILAARQSRAPGMFRAIGALAFVAGLATPIFGVESAQARLNWEAAHLTILRFEGGLFVCLGTMIVSAILPAKT
ncbi:MAG: hypothetical protein NT069_36025 [Planctomycetota bacterium]|nr:hypothetical protein [Planctomycetota bacterium]